MKKETEKNIVKVFVTPPTPAYTALLPPLPSGQQGTNLHLKVISHLAKSAV